MWSKSGKKRTSIRGNTLPCLTWETWRTIHYELTGIVCVIWLGTVLLVWHIDQVFPFTLTPLQAAAAQVPKKDKDDFSVFWLAANDPPDLCWDKVASSFFDCKYNLQLIGKCVIICITRNIFTMKSFYSALSVTLLAKLVFLLLPFWPDLIQKRTAFATTDVNSHHSFPFMHILHRTKQKVFQIQ